MTHPVSSLPQSVALREPKRATDFIWTTQDPANVGKPLIRLLDNAKFHNNDASVTHTFSNPVKIDCKTVKIHNTSITTSCLNPGFTMDFHINLIINVALTFNMKVTYRRPPNTQK